MTPQLQQAIKLLQLSSQELETQILEALEANPLLDREDLAAFDSEIPAGEEAESVSAGDAKSADDGLDQLPAEDDGWDQHYSSMPSMNGVTASRNNYEGPDRQLDFADRDADGLVEHLLWQLNLSHAQPTDLAIGVAIIDAINEDGYLTESPESIQQSLLPDTEVELDEVEAMLTRIQHFDPLGVGATSVQDCLTIQLRTLDEDTPGLSLAKAVVAHHLNALASQDLSGLRRDLNAREDQLREAIELVRSLEPRPGSHFSSAPTEYVKPDVVVEKRGGRWLAMLPDDIVPRLRVNDYYANLIGHASKEDSSYLRGQLQEARWLIKSLEARNETLLKVANAIVEHQSDFFEQGPQAMKPLVLREVADTIEMHESTVSRVTSRKYMLTSRGVFEFKYFFSSHVGTSDGGEMSATAIQAMIGKYVADEPPSKPMSDSKIAQLLNDRGIDVARRTVAKYREALNIPSSSKRKRLI